MNALLWLTVTVFIGTAWSGPTTLEREEKKTVPVDGQHRIHVQNFRGKTIVNGRTGATSVTIRAAKLVRAGDRDVAEAWMEDLYFDVEVDGNQVSIISHQPDRIDGVDNLWAFIKGARYKAQIDYTIEVPVDFEAKLSSASGDVQVTSLRGDVKVVGSSGDVFIKDLGRRAFVEVSSGDVDIESVEGDVHLVVSSGDAVISRIGGSLNARATSGDLEVYDVVGEVDAEVASGNLLVRGCGGDTHVKAASGDCVLSELAGNVKASAASGDVDVVLAPRSGLEYIVHTASGNVRIVFHSTADVGFVLDVNTTAGTIEGDLDIRLDKVTRQALRGTVGNGDGRLYVETASGNIRINQTERQD